MSRYKSEDLQHIRILNCYGRRRGWGVISRTRPPVPPDEVKHENSAVVPSGYPGVVFVVEWTGGEIARHRVHLTK